MGLLLGLAAGAISGSIAYFLYKAHRENMQAEDVREQQQRAIWPEWLASSHFAIYETFILAASAALLTFGINTGFMNSSFEDFSIPAEQSAELRSVLAEATLKPGTPVDDPVWGPAPGKIYIQRGLGLNGDDAIMILSPSDGGYVVKRVSVNSRGFLTAPGRPEDSFKPVFVRVGNEIVLNPDIDFSVMGALASSANSSQLSATSQVAALRLAAAGAHDVSPSAAQ